MSRIVLQTIPIGYDRISAEVEPDALQAMARQSLKRADRIDAAMARLQDLFMIMHDRVDAERRDALRAGENGRAAALDRDLDELVSAFNKAARGDDQ